MDLAERIRTLREEKGWTQRDLATASNIAPATISRLEAGKVEELRSNSFGDLAAALDVSMDYLAGRTTRLTGKEQSSGSMDKTILDVLDGLTRLPPERRRLAGTLVRALILDMYGASDALAWLSRIPSERLEGVESFLSDYLEGGGV